MPQDDDNLTGVFADLEEISEDRDKVSLGHVLETIESRGVGPLYVLTGAVVLLIGSIPGLPAVAGILLVLVSVQMVRSSRGIWLPRPIARLKLPADNLDLVSDRARRAAVRIAPFVRERLTFMIEGVFQRSLIALITAIFGVALVVIGFIPGLPPALSVPLIVLGIGMSGNDGAWILAAVVLLAPVAYILVTRFVL
ncbi:exopolysaccharide biosynthesis protein [Celeribacter indicus]|uniref:Exopolysaccharide synthesis, exoD n=1 Tax=Celeribacter indicus TaxID=1208324 RepID=A0A0B5E758_9RHOB|nr:exopolysaccharide biosynthesis protein [Celeribacter indicus]AJE48137.1 exopolysaccharide synthesis, exoD [Celeribacter indicus]SDW33517.1 Uncharacterized conserved protein [Celeribacter indicus]